MLLIKKNNKYTCENSNETLSVTGEVTVESDFRKIVFNGSIKDLNDVELGHFCYEQNDGDIIDKRISYLNKMYLNDVEILLDDTMLVLVQQFDLNNLT